MRWFCTTQILISLSAGSARAAKAIITDGTASGPFRRSDPLCDKRDWISCTQCIRRTGKKTERILELMGKFAF